MSLFAVLHSILFVKRIAPFLMNTNVISFDVVVVVAVVHICHRLAGLRLRDSHFTTDMLENPTEAYAQSQNR